MPDDDEDVVWVSGVRGDAVDQWYAVVVHGLLWTTHEVSELAPLATLADLDCRIDWALDHDEKRLAASALEDASDLAHGYGRDWTPDNVPRLVRVLVLAACVRYLRNRDGYTQSRSSLRRAIPW